MPKLILSANGAGVSGHRHAGAGRRPQGPGSKARWTKWGLSGVSMGGVFPGFQVRTWRLQTALTPFSAWSLLLRFSLALWEAGHGCVKRGKGVGCPNEWGFWSLDERVILFAPRQSHRIGLVVALAGARRWSRDLTPHLGASPFPVELVLFLPLLFVFFLSYLYFAHFYTFF